jgi:hypothetical protein
MRCRYYSCTAFLAGSLASIHSPGLSGPIDPLKGLTKLMHTDLDLWGAHLSGPIDGVKEMGELTRLRLDGNNLIGNIDALSGLTKLTSLYLNGNPKLSGAIEAVAGLTQLTTLHLGGDDLSGVVVHAGPIDWSKISDCGMSGNKFRCPIPRSAIDNCWSIQCGTCTGSSANLSASDCTVWQSAVNRPKQPLFQRGPATRVPGPQILRGPVCLH